MKQVVCILTDNDCYREGRIMKPKGVMVHSTGANNPYIRRYVQPSENDPDREKLLELLGINRYQNDWNGPDVDKCVHAFIGKLADGSVGVCQTLPWNMRGWHAGRGKKGTANDTHISFEICEDSLEDSAYFRATYDVAVALTAQLCGMYELDPMEDGVVICHAEGYRRGIASGHADVEHWWPKMGTTMDDFRRDVANVVESMKKEGETMETGDRPSGWAEQATEWCKRKGIINGDGQGNYDWKGALTREAAGQMIYNIFEKLDKLEEIPDVR